MHYPCTLSTAPSLSPYT
uniref:Uncharacterized protein n=1 Tax=Anguilla anguilla TaxID=7936 RepID=A0A0E9SF65_ANGAN